MMSVATSSRVSCLSSTSRHCLNNTNSRLGVAKPVLAAPAARSRAVGLRCRASQEPTPPPPQNTEQPGAGQPQQQPDAPQPTTAQLKAEAAQKEADTPLILRQGQGTAIVTGGISIVFGVAYLILVILLDWRGGEMMPPPPEAYGP